MIGNPLSPERWPFVSIIIVHYNGVHLLEPCLQSLAALDYPPSRYEVLVVDNGSTDGSDTLIEQRFPHVRWIAHTINNFCRAINVGVSLATGELLAFLNNDTKVDPRWLIELVRMMQRDPTIGACGSKVLLMDGRINSTGHRALQNFYWVDRGFKESDVGQYDRVEVVEGLTSGAVLIRRCALEQVGLLDEDLHMYWDDVDLSLRLRQHGWSLYYVPSSVVHHVYHGTASQREAETLVERNRLLLIAKHDPQKLADALLGGGYWAYPTQPQPGALLRLMPMVFDKLVKHHGVEVAGPIVRELFDQLHRVQQHEWEALSREYAARLGEYQQRLTAVIHERDAVICAREAVLRARGGQLAALAAHIDRINTSRTYRYLVRPLWSVLNLVRRMRRTLIHRGSPNALPSKARPGLQMDAAQTMRMSPVRAADAEAGWLKEQFDQNGYLIVDFGFPERLIERAADFVQHHFAGGDGAEDGNSGQALYHGARAQDAWKFDSAVRELATFPAVLTLLRVLYGKNPLPFQTLNFPIGTEQAVHSDVVHFNCWPNDGSLCGVWVALEDIDERSGPLIYYPGTHNWPELYPFNFNLPAGAEWNPDYEKNLGAFVRGLGLEPQRATLKKGQALIWAANLLHGGDVVRDQRRTRMSQVTHYFFEGSAFYWTPVLSDLGAGKVHLRTPDFFNQS